MNNRSSTYLLGVVVLVMVMLAVSLVIRPSASSANTETADIVTLVDEGFEGTFPPSGWTRNGHWGKSDCNPNTGSYSAWVEGTGGIACQSGMYHPNESSYLQYGPFSLSDAISATLTFDIYLWSAPGDTFSWEASKNGTNFYGISVTDDFSQGWQPDGLDLADVPVLGDLRGEANVWIRFQWDTDDFAEAFEGVFIDNVKVVKGVPPSETEPPGPPTATSSPTATATSSDSSDAKVYLPPVIKNAGPTLTPTFTSTVGPPTETATPDPENDPPVFPSPLNTNISTDLIYNDLGQVTGAKTTIKILTPATDPDGDPITYSWTASNGTITGSGLTAVWDRVIYWGAPVAGKVTVTARDGRGGTAKVEININ